MCYKNIHTVCECVAGFAFIVHIVYLPCPSSILNFPPIVQLTFEKTWLCVTTYDTYCYDILSINNVDQRISQAQIPLRIVKEKELKRERLWSILLQRCHTLITIVTSRASSHIVQDSLYLCFLKIICSELPRIETTLSFSSFVCPSLFYAVFRRSIHFLVPLMVHGCSTGVWNKT